MSKIGKRTMKVRLPKITSCQNVPQGVYFLSFSRLAMEGKYAALAEEDAEIAFGFGSVNQSAEQAAFPSFSTSTYASNPSSESEKVFIYGYLISLTSEGIDYILTIL